MFHPSESLLSQHLPLYSHHILKSLIHSPPLIDQIPNTQAFAPLTLELPKSPPTLNFQQKLGHLYENALTLLLKNSSRYQLITNNLQIQNKKITVGELDYIIHDNNTGHKHHLELATKFYLAHTNTQNGKTTYPGPDARDNFHRKLHHLTTHQLQLTNHPAAKSILKEKYNITTTIPTHLIHGIIYLANTSSPPPPETAQQITTRPYTNLTKILPSTQEIRIIPKPLWLCPPDPEWLTTLPIITPQELQSITTKRVTLIYSNKHQVPTFITPPTWPNH